MVNRNIHLLLLFTCALMLIPAFAPCQDVENPYQAESTEASPAAMVDEAVGSSAIQGVEIAWDADRPAPGTLVKIRVRGEVLESLLQNQHGWEFIAGEERLAAALVPASLPEPPEKHEYEFVSTKTDHGDTLELDIDRGANPLPLSSLEIHFAATRYIGLVKVMSSPDGETYVQAGKYQVVYQEVTGGQVYRLGELEFDADPERYIRLELPSPASGGVQTIIGWFEPKHKLEVYKGEAVLGTLRDGGEPNESVWPILMNPMRLPIAKLKVLADETGEVRRMHLATMNGANLGNSVGQEIIWANELTQNYDQVTNKWIAITGESANGPFAVVVNDDSNLLRLRGVEVYLLEHWLVFEMPEAGTGQLWQRNADEPLAEATVFSSDDVQQAQLAGTLKEWSMSRALAVEPQTTKRWTDQPLEFARNGGWRKRMYGYMALGLVLLVAGITILRSEMRSQKKG